jgi:phosphohistidine phosphatase
MLITFLRHAEAEGHASSDFDRRLTTKGIEQAVKAGKFCSRSGLVPDVILSSPVIRARQTAEIVAKAVGVDVDVVEWLACGMEPEDCLKQLSGLAEVGSILLVGHEPDFSEAIAHLIGLPEHSALKVRKATLTAVEIVDFHAGCGQLQFFVPVRLM